MDKLELHTKMLELLNKLLLCTANGREDIDNLGACLAFDKILFREYTEDFIDNNEYFDLSGEFKRSMNEVVISWEYFSGDLKYPIGGRDTYHKTLYKWSGTQGELRRELIGLIIEHQERCVEENTPYYKPSLLKRLKNFLHRFDTSIYNRLIK